MYVEVQVVVIFGKYKLFMNKKYVFIRRIKINYQEVKYQWEETRLRKEAKRTTL